MKKLIAMLLAVAMVLAFAGCAKTEAPAETQAPVVETEAPVAETEAPVAETEEAGPLVVDYAGFMAAETDTEVVVETYVQANESWWDGAVSLYCQGPDGAYYMYGMKCTEEEAAKLVPGTKIRAVGGKAVYEGEIEIMDGTIEVIEGDPYIAEPTDVTALMGTDALEAEMNKLFAFKGVTVAPITDAEGNEKAFLYKWDGSGAQGDDVYFNLTDGTNTVNCCINVYMIGTGSDSDAYKAVEAFQIGDKIDVTGFMYWYQGPNPHINSVTAAE